jgi:uncharacterized protein YcbK (DUF882 family)
MKLGKFFTLSEFTRSTAASKLGLDNSPTKTDFIRLRLLVSFILDPLRTAAGLPVDITSGYRSQAVNAAVGGSSSSSHMKGEAADIKVKGMSAVALATLIVKLALPFDEVIWYDAERGGHVHVSHRTGRNRGKMLHAPASGGYVSWQPEV